jgi:hypothetical protein
MVLPVVGSDANGDVSTPTVLTSALTSPWALMVTSTGTVNGPTTANDPLATD